MLALFTLPVRVVGKSSDICRMKSFEANHAKANNANETNAQIPKLDGATLVAASTVAAIRLRGEEVKGSPKLKSVIYDSVRLVRLVMSEIAK